VFSVWSATIRLSQPFSSVSRRNSLTSSAFMPRAVAPAPKGVFADAEFLGHLDYLLWSAHGPAVI